MKKWIVPFAAVLAVTAVATLCWTTGAVAQTAIKPAVIYSTGGKFDKSFNEGVSMGVEKFNRESVIRDLKERGVSPEPDEHGFAAFHVKDPDGFSVQLEDSSAF